MDVWLKVWKWKQPPVRSSRWGAASCKRTGVVYHVGTVGIAPEPKRKTSCGHPQSHLNTRKHDVAGAEVGSSSADSRAESKEIWGVEGKSG